VELRLGVDDVVRRTVPCDIVGPFAVHRTIHWDRFWTVTHRRTGCSLITATTRKEGLSLARAFSDLGVSWDFDNPTAMPTNTKRRAKALRKRLVKTEAAK
jgi:hypothetical protein